MKRELSLSGGGRGIGSVEAARAELLVRLLSKHQDELFRYIFALLPHEEDARDVLQETSVALYLLQNRADALGDLRDALVGEQPRNRQRNQRPYFSVRNDADAALLRPDRCNRNLHVALVDSGNDDVVAVVPDARGVGLR